MQISPDAHRTYRPHIAYEPPGLPITGGSRGWSWDRNRLCLVPIPFIQPTVCYPVKRAEAHVPFSPQIQGPMYLVNWNSHFGGLGIVCGFSPHTPVCIYLFIQLASRPQSPAYLILRWNPRCNSDLRPGRRKCASPEGPRDSCKSPQLRGPDCDSGSQGPAA